MASAFSAFDRPALADVGGNTALLNLLADRPEQKHDGEQHLAV
jgi:hypothetical protein